MIMKYENEENSSTDSEGKKVFRGFQLIVLVSLIALLSVSCDDDDDDDNQDDSTVTFYATLSGANEVPPNASTGTGTATLTFNENTKVFNVVVTYTGVSATGAHIHLGDSGIAGGVAFGFPSVTSPINYTSPPLTAQQEADLFANRYYVNIHSAEYPDGEIRGQLMRQ
jgi:hypothetical protein